MSWRWWQTAILTQVLLRTVAALLPHLGWGCSTVGHWGPKALCLPLALTSTSCLQLTRTVCASGYTFFNAHLLLLFFRLFTQVHLLIDGSVKGQYITSLLKSFFHIHSSRPSVIPQSTILLISTLYILGFFKIKKIFQDLYFTAYFIYIFTRSSTTTLCYWYLDYIYLGISKAFSFIFTEPYPKQILWSYQKTIKRIIRQCAIDSPNNTPQILNSDFFLLLDWLTS